VRIQIARHDGLAHPDEQTTDQHEREGPELADEGYCQRVRDDERKPRDLQAAEQRQRDDARQSRQTTTERPVDGRDEVRRPTQSRSGQGVFCRGRGRQAKIRELVDRPKSEGDQRRQPKQVEPVARHGRAEEGDPVAWQDSFEVRPGTAAVMDGDRRVDDDEHAQGRDDLGDLRLGPQRPQHQEVGQRSCQRRHCDGDGRGQHQSHAPLAHVDVEIGAKHRVGTQREVQHARTSIDHDDPMCQQGVDASCAQP
jgi:hypothetical protein